MMYCGSSTFLEPFLFSSYSCHPIFFLGATEFCQQISYSPKVLLLTAACGGFLGDVLLMSSTAVAVCR